MDEDSFELREKNKTELNKEFYEKKIEECKIMLKSIEIEGLDALNSIDRPKGIIWAKERLNEAIIYFKGKIGGLK